VLQITPLRQKVSAVLSDLGQTTSAFFPSPSRVGRIGQHAMIVGRAVLSLGEPLRLATFPHISTWDALRSVRATTGDALARAKASRDRGLVGDRVTLLAIKARPLRREQPVASRP
jgi:hypothetical protein